MNLEEAVKWLEPHVKSVLPATGNLADDHLILFKAIYPLVQSCDVHSDKLAWAGAGAIWLLEREDPPRDLLLQGYNADTGEVLSNGGVGSHDFSLPE